MTSAALPYSPFPVQLVGLLKENGVMSVNYFGSVDANLHLVARTLRSVLEHVRCFGDEHESEATRNFVFFASRHPMRFRSLFLHRAGLPGTVCSAASLRRFFWFG